MDNEIQKLSTKLEELKKRLKAINTSQNVLSKLITIQDYFDQIQSYLNDLNHAFNNHVISCDEHDQLIKELQEQINSINLKLESLTNIEDYNIEQMSADIESLKQNITDITAEITAIKGNSNSTIETIDNKLTELNQTIEELITKVDTNTSDISSLKTTTQNLSTTQTNLTATQTTLTNNINSIDTRLTKVEANVNTLTGGVDVSELDNRIENVELKTAIHCPCCLNTMKFGITKKIITTSTYSFCNDLNYPTIHNCKLTYTSTGVGSLTILAQTSNNVQLEKFVIDLSTNPSEYQFSLTQNKAVYHGAIKFKFSATSDIIYHDLTILTYGSGTINLCSPSEYDFICFDNKVFVTKRENTGIKYGHFSADEPLDLSKLTNFFSYQQDSNTYYTFACYMPYTTFDDDALTYTGYYDGILAGGASGSKFIPINTINTTGETHAEISNDFYVDGKYDVGVSSLPIVMYPAAAYDNFYIKNYNSASASGFMIGYNLLYASWARNNYQTIGSTYLKDASNIYGIGLRKDGYFYFKYGSKYVKLNTPNCYFGTLYIEQDGSLNAYISSAYNTYKYKIVANNEGSYSASLITTIQDCDCIYETYNNQIIKHQAISKTWKVTTLEY